jgi:hypothetical protein
MKGLGKILIKERKKIIGLAKVLIEQAECKPKNYFTIGTGMNKQLMKPSTHDDEMRKKIKTACDNEDECTQKYYDYYSEQAIAENMTPATLETIGCTTVEPPADVEGEDDTPTGPCEGVSNDRLWSYQRTQGWMTDVEAQQEPVVDKTVSPEVRYDNGIGPVDWPDKKGQFFVEKDFVNDQATGSDKCTEMPLYHKKTGREIKIDSDKIKTKALEEYCYEKELEKAGDGTWTEFYTFEYVNGLQSCLINNWTYVKELGIDYNMGRDKCFESIKVPGTGELQGAMGYEFPVNRKFYRINKACVKAKWKNKMIKVDPYKNYGGEDRVSPIPQRTKTYFDRDEYQPYGSGQSQQSSLKQDIRNRLTGRYADVPLNKIYGSDEGGEVVVRQDVSTGPNPLERYGDGYFEDITII